EHEGLAIANDFLPVNLHSGKFTRTSARCQNNMLGFVIRFLSSLIRHLNLASLFQLAGSFNEFDLILLEKKLNSFAIARSNIAASLDHCSKISLEVLYLYTIIFRMGDIFEDIGTLQQRLGGDATPIEAHTSNFGLFHDSDLHTELRGTDSGYISAGAAPNDDQIIFRHSVLFRIRCQR